MNAKVVCKHILLSPTPIGLPSSTWISTIPLIRRKPMFKVELANERTQIFY